MKDYTIDGFNGLGKQQPLLAVTATIFLLSLTGIPLTAGFQSKFYYVDGCCTKRASYLAGNFCGALCCYQRLLLFQDHTGHVL